MMTLRRKKEGKFLEASISECKSKNMKSLLPSVAPGRAVGCNVCHKSFFTVKKKDLPLLESTLKSIVNYTIPISEWWWRYHIHCCDKCLSTHIPIFMDCKTSFTLRVRLNSLRKTVINRDFLCCWGQGVKTAPWEQSWETPLSVGAQFASA